MFWVLWSNKTGYSTQRDMTRSQGDPTTTPRWQGRQCPYSPTVPEQN